MYSRPELHTALSRAGFTAITFAGDFTGSPVRPQNRTVIFASTPLRSPKP